MGDFVAIPLANGSFAFGRVISEPLIAFYDIYSEEVPDIDKIRVRSVKYILAVMNYAINSGRWKVIGSSLLEDTLREPVSFFMQSRSTGEISIYIDGEIIPASFEECVGLENCAVWDPEHVEDRLLDEFYGRPNKWSEQLSLKSI